MIDTETSQAIHKIEQIYEPQLASTLRYARFMAGETPEEWKGLLGDDVVLLTHGKYTAEVADRFLRDNLDDVHALNSEDMRKLAIVSLIHDWGEIVIGDDGVGDVSFDQKTDGDESSEVKMFQRVTAGIENVQVRNSLRGLYRRIALDRTTRLGRAFNAVERLGYLQTALRASAGVEGRRIGNWKGLVGNVLSNQIRPLLDYAQEYPGAATFLREHAAQITQMFAETDAEPVPTGSDALPAFDYERLSQSREAWNASAYAQAR